MADAIASLGFNADTSGLTKASSALEDIVPAASSAAGAADAATASITTLGKAGSAAAGGIGKTADAAKAAGGVISNVLSPTQKAALAAEAAAQGFSTLGGIIPKVTKTQSEMAAAATSGVVANDNFVKSTNDLAQSANAVIKPVTSVKAAIAETAALALSGAVGVGELTSIFFAMISPINILIIAIGEIITILIKVINWFHVAGFALQEFGAILPTLAPYILAFVAAMTLIYSPAIINGIGALTIAFVRLSLSMLALLGLPALIVAGILAIIAVAYEFSDQINNAIGVNIKAIITDVGNFIINGFVVAFKTVVAIWNDFPGLFAAAVTLAVNAFIDGLNTMTSKANQALKLLGGFANMMGVSGAAPQFGTVGHMEMDPNAKKSLDDTTKSIHDMAVAQMQVDQMGPLGKNIAAGAAAAGAKVKQLGNYISSLGDKKAKADKGGSGVDKMAESYDKLVLKAQSAINANKTAIDTIGMSAEAIAEAKHQTDLLNEATQKHINLTDAQRTELMSLGKQWGDTEVAAKAALDQFNFEKDTVKGFVSDLKSGLEQGKGFWKSFSDAALNALNKITDRLLNQVIDALFTVGKAAAETSYNIGLGGGSGGGGLLGGIAKFFGSLFAKGGTFGTSQKFASGGAFTNSVISKPTLFQFANGTKLGEMGEKGPEGILPLKRGPNGQLGVQAHGTGAANSNSPPVYVSVVVNGSADVQQQRSTGPNGEQYIKIIIDTVQKGITNGSFDKSNRARYNIAPGKVSR